MVAQSCHKTNVTWYLVASAFELQMLCCYCRCSNLSFCLLSTCSTFPPKFALASSPWKEVWWTWNFNTVCRMVTICGKLLFWQSDLLTGSFRSSNSRIMAANTLQQQGVNDVVAKSFAAMRPMMVGIPASPGQKLNSVFWTSEIHVPLSLTL